MIYPYYSLLFSLASTALATGIMWHTIRDSMTAHIADATRWRMVCRLRNAGVAVQITFVQSNDHPQTINDQEIIIVNADWTNWQDRRYKAASIDVALAQAINDMERGI